MQVVEKIILGIDPGTSVMGFGIISVVKGKMSLVAIDELILKKYANHEIKLKKIFDRTLALIDEFHPDEVALEAPFFGKNVQAMLKLGRAQGVSIAAAITMGLEIYEYSPKKIKQSITGNGNAAKEQVAAMLSHLLKTPIQSTHFDATDALACAICHHQNSGLMGSGPGKKFSSWKSFVTNNPDKVK
jgi:crossover junction endodeoxyribonuclease RuvC